MKKDNHATCRLLIISSLYEQASHHIAFMNAVFAAQRKDIPIDVCQLSSTAATNQDGKNQFRTSLGLSQAASLTDSVYIQVETKDMLLPYLLVCIFPSINSLSNSKYF